MNFRENAAPPERNRNVSPFTCVIRCLRPGKSSGPRAMYNAPFSRVMTASPMEGWSYIPVYSAYGAEGSAILPASSCCSFFFSFQGIGQELFKCFCAVILCRQFQVMIDNVPHDGVSRIGRRFAIAQPHETQLQLRNKSTYGGKSPCGTRVEPYAVATVLFHEPARCVNVGFTVRLRRDELAPVQVSQLGRRKECVSVHHAVGQMQAAPLHHVCYCGIDPPGRSYDR